MPPSSSSTVELAEQIARHAHAGQTDKAGAPYIDHPARVAARLTGDAQAVAWLHDVVEDTDWDGQALVAAGVPVDVVDDVLLLTHRPGEPRPVYLARVRSSARAVAVKRADVADNTDPERVALLAPDVRDRLAAKYARTLAVLDAAPAAGR